MQGSASPRARERKSPEIAIYSLQAALMIKTLSSIPSLMAFEEASLLPPLLSAWVRCALRCPEESDISSTIVPGNEGEEEEEERGLGGLELELELIQPHMAQKPVLRGEVGCACVAREVSVERGGMGERGCASKGTHQEGMASLVTPPEATNTGPGFNRGSGGGDRPGIWLRRTGRGICAYRGGHFL